MPNARHKLKARKVKVESMNTLKGSEELKPLIPFEYCDLAEAFIERESDMLLPASPTHSAIEILLGLYYPS